MIFLYIVYVLYLYCFANYIKYKLSALINNSLTSALWFLPYSEKTTQTHKNACILLSFC